MNLRGWRRGFRFVVAVFVTLAIGLAVDAFGLGLESEGNEPIPEASYGEWEGTGVMPVINHTSRVYRTSVNGNDHFYYRGDASALNDILAKFAAVKVPVREVVFRPGPGPAASWREKRIPYDWQLHLLTGIAGHGKPPGSQIELGELNPTLTVFVGGGNVELGKVKIPEGITFLDAGDMRKRYLKGLKSDDSRTRGHAAYRLAQLEPYNKENVPLFVELLDDEGNAPYVAAVALGEMGKNAEAALGALKKALKDQNERGRKKFLEVIDKIQNGPVTAEAAKAYDEARAEIARFRKTLAKEPAK